MLPAKATGAQMHPANNDQGTAQWGDRMRLTCPNCGAQYEIPDDVLPQSGRDVQCSNCGDTWFQHHPDHPAEDEAATDQYTADTGHDDSGREADPETDDAADTPGPDAAGIDTDADTGTDMDTAPGPTQRRRLDPDVTSVLREEAEREARARARDSGSLETQPELGLDSGDDGTDRRSREARARMARLRGQSDADDTPDTDHIDPSSRRGLLPDIEEISSSLRSNDDRADSADTEDMYPEAAPGGQNGGGFRRGFVLIVMLSAVLTLLYVFAPQISRAVPALAAVMGEYVETVNGARGWLDDQIASLMRRLDGMASSPTGGDAN